MNKNIIGLSIFIILFLISSCHEEFDEKEVYKKVVYIVHSENMINYFTHPFTGSSTEGFISLYCSGSLMPEKDIDLEIGFDDELIEKYNYIEFENEEAKYVKFLSPEYFNIPSFRVKIKGGEPFGIMPIFVTSEGLSPDTTYVIPLRIIKISDYEISEDLSSILYAIRLENSYSGLYQMTGSLLAEGSTDMPQQVFKDKTLVPIDQFSCRMFVSTENELRENIQTRTVTFSIKADNTIAIKEENDILDLGGSTYNPDRNMISLNYSFLSAGERYEIQEKLIRLEE